MSTLRLALVFGAVLLASAAEQSEVIQLEVNSGNGAVSFQEVSAKSISNGQELAETELFCKQFEMRMPDGTVVKLSRSKTYGQLFKAFAKVVVVVALVAGIAAMSVYTAGLFEAFLAANEGVPVYNFVSSGGVVVSKTYMGIYYNKVAIAILTSTTAMLAGGAGFGAGGVATLAATKIGMDLQSYMANQKVGDELKWLNSVKDACNYVHFDVLSDGKARDWKAAAVEGPWQKYSWGTDGIYALEADSDVQAEEALSAWCSFYAKHDLFGKGSTMPRPAACEHVFKVKPELESCSGSYDESMKKSDVKLTCKHLISLSKDEMQFQVLMTQMNLIKTTAEGGPKVGAPKCEKKDSCSAVGSKPAGDQAFCSLSKDENPTLCSGEEKGDILEELEEIENNKAAAIFDCLAVSSCQLVRKDYDQIKGRVRSIGSFGLKHQKHIDMRATIIKKCLSHSQLMGPLKANEGCIKGKDCPEDIKEVEEEEEVPDAPEDAEEPASPQ